MEMACEINLNGKKASGKSAAKKFSPTKESKLMKNKFKSLLESFVDLGEFMGDVTFKIKLIKTFELESKNFEFSLTNSKVSL
jgi:hypothetical protein